MVHFPFLEQNFALLPHPALFWRERNTLVVTDIHFGKAATFRAQGVGLPAGGTAHNLARLSAALQHTKAERLLILGDLLHAKLGRSASVIEKVTAWRNEFAQLTVDVVLGNHDSHAGKPPVEWRMNTMEELIEHPFVWRHVPSDSDAGYVIAGHVHPAVVLRGGGERLKVGCFYFGRNHAILPAFGDFTGYGIVRPKVGDHVFAIAEQEVIEITA